MVPLKHGKIKTLLLYFWILNGLLVFKIKGAVVPPPWANPKINPCASQPRGWQLLYWPPNGKCYKIFQKGYPCPEDMELSPSSSVSDNESFSAECRCPPMTAQSAQDGKCYELFTAGPCDKGWYFAPDTQYTSKSDSKRRWGTCQQIQSCSNPNELFWPANGRCYNRFTRGPCPKGQLLTTGNDGVAVCRCNYKQEMNEYWSPGNGCFQHYTKGPCKEKGHIFLPDKRCGCHQHLPHYHEKTEQCYEIGLIGPCQMGELFQLNPDTGKGTCTCRTGNIRYSQDQKCYRPYTQGPCNPGQIIVNTTACIEQPCDRGHLYFPEDKRCYRLGTRGPCSQGKLVTFDFETRPSLDGLSYNGMCRCENSKCEEDLKILRCENNFLFYENRCYRLYTQGPCAKGAWITPKRRGKQEIWTESKRKQGFCDCMPGYTKSVRNISGKNVTECLSPTVILAEYLNKNFFLINSRNVTEAI